MLPEFRFILPPYNALTRKQLLTTNRYSRQNKRRKAFLFAYNVYIYSASQQRKHS